MKMCLVSCPVPSDHFKREQKLTIKSGFFYSEDYNFKIILDPALSGLMFTLIKQNDDCNLCYIQQCICRTTLRYSRMIMFTNIIDVRMPHW